MAQLWMRLSPDSHPDIEHGRVTLEEIHVVGAEDVQSARENISYEVYVREIDSVTGCQSSGNASNPPATVGELFAAGDTLNDIEHVEAAGFELSRDQTTRMCARLMPDGHDLLPNESFDVIFEFALRP